jgi:hypothetical protein
MRFEKCFKSYSNDQWHYIKNKQYLTWQTYFNVKSEYYWWSDINYTKKPITQKIKSNQYWIF